MFFVGGVVHGVSRRVHDPRLRWHKNLLTLATHQTGKLLGIASLGWAGHLVHVALPGSRGIRIGWLQLLTFLPSPHGLLPLLTGNWQLYAEHPDRLPHVFGRLDSATGSAILTFTGTYSPRSGSLWLSDVAHHHLAVGIVALLVTHLLSVAELPRNPIASIHFDLAVSLAALGTASSFAANHLGAFTPYAFLANDLVAQAALYTHHQYIAGFFMCGAFAHGSIFLVRDTAVVGTVIGWMLAYRAGLVSLLSVLCLFLGFHTLGLYVHNDVMQAMGTPEKQVALLPVFAEWLQLAHGSHLGTTLTAGDFLVHHAIALGLHTTTLVLVKAAVNARSSKLMPDKATFGYGFPCDGPGRGGT